jgi:hypothetical protein
LGKTTKDHLASFPDKLPANPRDYKIYRQELVTLRSAWFELHKRVKPSADADMLRLPAPLICALLRRLKSIPEYRDIELAVFHTERLNYLQVIATNIREIARSIAFLIPGSKPFPPKLGLVGIPYSQAESLFLNCLIAHELGHFIFGEKQLKNVFEPHIQKALDAAFKAVAVPLTPQERKWIPTIVTDWVEELFCDLFAVLLVGPCYTYAFIELFDLCNLLDADGRLDPSAAATKYEFSDSHPALLFRLQQQAKMLEKIGWWADMSGSSSHYIGVLRNSEGAKPTDFTFPRFPKIQSNAVATALALSDVVSLEVEKALSPLDSGVSEYNRLKKVVTEYLRHGVVPSTVPDPDTGASAHPNPVTTLNVAYRLYLDEFAQLIGSIEKQNPNSIHDRNKWIKKLEMWTLKAVDDHELLERHREIKAKV